MYFKKEEDGLRSNRLHWGRLGLAIKGGVSEEKEKERGRRNY